ncbi:hypothetical protein C173_14945 [Paenibacillus sp. FSL R7-277]|uniref:hypothetical protein n=1 Tax=Paenibacillus sp. FSL R7-277 TaxID=1227352 RepID=UPI0003E1DCFA|nr:hypothetical protein [Paenibacillus sp. FSL R7-277]ETT72345.1 hypothetical protein C173_14945 [Paenibacillus sp. FSL R7-277]
MTYSFVVEPLAVQDFESEDERIERCKEWNLLPGSATRVKTYLYKRQGLTLPCEIIGFVDNQTVVVQFENKQQHCIHPAYLKEMQTASFGQRAQAAADARSEDPAEAAGETELLENQPVEEVRGEDDAEGAGSAGAAVGDTAERSESGSADAAGGVTAAETAAPAEKPRKPAASKKKPALQLPEDKLKVTAVVKEFTTVPNHFSDNDDEVIIYDNVAIEGHELAIDEVWSSHSATLKKLELKEGDPVSFEAKIVAKKLSQHPVKYKINNPSKMKVIQPDS